MDNGWRSKYETNSTFCLEGRLRTLWERLTLEETAWVTKAEAKPPWTNRAWSQNPNHRRSSHNKTKPQKRRKEKKCTKTKELRNEEKQESKNGFWRFLGANSLMVESWKLARKWILWFAFVEKKYAHRWRKQFVATFLLPRASNSMQHHHFNTSHKTYFLSLLYAFNLTFVSSSAFLPRYLNSFSVSLES